jgi:hypothetical protein
MTPPREAAPSPDLSKATPRPWRIAKMMEGAEQMRPEGMTAEQAAKWDALMAERNQPSRDNDGSWIIVAGRAGTESYTRAAAAAFKGTAKRGQTYCAPDPEGFANADLLVAAVNAYDPEAVARLTAENERLRATVRRIVALSQEKRATLDSNATDISKQIARRGGGDWAVSASDVFALIQYFATVAQEIGDIARAALARKDGTP